MSHRFSGPNLHKQCGAFLLKLDMERNKESGINLIEFFQKKVILKKYD